MSNGLDPNQDLVPNCLQRLQQTTKAAALAAGRVEALPARVNFCCLLITVVNSLKARQNIEHKAYLIENV